MKMRQHSGCFTKKLTLCVDGRASVDGWFALVLMGRTQEVVDCLDRIEGGSGHFDKHC